MSGPRPHEGTKLGTLHWLFRPSSEPRWMAAVWMGSYWEIPMYGCKAPESLTLWNYSMPAFPPNSPEFDARRSGFTDCRYDVQTKVDSYVHERFSYDPSTNAWESDSEIDNAIVETLDEIIADINARVAEEFGPGIPAEGEPS